MMRSSASLIVAGALSALLSACSGTNRFDGGFQPVAARPSPAGAVYQTPPAGGSAPVSGPVTAEPLPPPANAGIAGGAPPTQGSTLPPPTAQADPLFRPSPPPTAATTGSTQTPATGEQPATLGGGGRVATLGEGAQTGRRSGPVSSRDGVVGGWTAREATGGTCRVTLSSAPALDLYRASAGGCQNKDLQKITAWDYRDGEVYLYQAGGAVAARLRVNDAGSMTGSVARSGAGVSLAR